MLAQSLVSLAERGPSSERQFLSGAPLPLSLFPLSDRPLCEDTDLVPYTPAARGP